MTITMPETTSSFGTMSLVVLTTKPVDLTAITPTEIAAGENISCHEIGDWWSTATTDKVSRARKMCQTNTAQALGVTTYEAPPLQYTANPQTVATPGSAGNEAYDALPPRVARYIVRRLGVDGKTTLVADDAYQVIPVETGPQVWGASQDDAGGENVINQDLGYLGGYSEPIDGVITV